MIDLYNDKTKENILKIINKSYLANQNSSQYILFKEKLRTFEKNRKFADYVTDDIITLKKYDNLKVSLSTGLNDGIKINYKKLKKYKKELEKIENENPDIINKYKHFNDYLKEEDQYNNLMLDKDYYENIFGYQIDMVMDFLKEHDFITQDNKLTILGSIAKNINECNEIILSYIVFNGFLKDLTIPEIVGLLSIFIEESTNEETTISSLKLNPKLENILYQIGEKSEYYAEKENNFIQKNDIYIFNNWGLNLSQFQVNYKWAELNNFNEIKKLYNSFEGNFIKNILRVNNIVKELISVADILKDTELYQKLIKIEDILIRDQVTIDSLYV